MIMQTATIAIGNTTVHYEVRGSSDAPWLAVCHGGGLNSASFVPLAERLAPRWRVLLWDLPGHGRSRPMPERFDMGVCVEAFAAVLEAAGVDRAMLLGFSFGGVVAQLFAERAPERVAGLIAYACFAPQLVPTPLPPVQMAAAMRAAFETPPWPQARAAFAAMCSILPEVCAEVENSLDAMGRADFLRVVEALGAVDAYSPAFRVAGPVMFVRGAADANATALDAVGTALRAAYPGMTDIVVEDAGHCAHQDNPAAFESKVEACLNVVPATPNAVCASAGV